MRQFAQNRRRSDIRVTKRPGNNSYNGGGNTTLATVKPQEFKGGYTSNATQMCNAAINRKRRG